MKQELLNYESDETVTDETIENDDEEEKNNIKIVEEYSAEYKTELEKMTSSQVRTKSAIEYKPKETDKEAGLVFRRL